MMRYLITGATGYIGSMLVKKIREDDPDADITLIVRDRSRVKYDDVSLYEMDITDNAAMNRINGEYDEVYHLASVTKSATMVSKPVEVADGIVIGTKNLLEMSLRCRAKSVVYVSSMEVYGDVDCSDGHRANEDELGYVDIYNPRSCYPLAKRMAEHYCYTYFKEYGLPVKVARLAQTFGRGVSVEDNRVFSQFARSAIAGENIVLHTMGKSIGNYCGIDDVLNALILLSINGKNGEAYNVVNEQNTMSIREMAELVANNFSGGRSKVIVKIPEGNSYGYAADTGLRLSATKLMALDWIPTMSLVDMYEQMISNF